YCDVDHYIDYMLANIYVGMGDWPHHNWYAARERGPDSEGYKFFCWDSEGAFRNNNVTGVGNGIAQAYGNLRANAEFNLRFADHAQCHMFNNGALVPSNSMDRIQVLADSFEFGIVTENSRWNHISLSAWRSRIDDKKNNYLAGRTSTVLGYLRGAGLYPDVDAPVFNQHGGMVPNGFGLTMMSANAPNVYYTLDGSDPREFDTSNPLGTLYAAPVPLTYNVLVHARARDLTDAWSAMEKALFVVPGTPELRVTEVMYNPYGVSAAESNLGYSATDFEFIEFQNTGSNIIGLAGMRLSGGIDFDFTEGAVQTLAPGELVVIVENLAAFTNRYPNWMSMNIAGEYGENLSNNGEEVNLKNHADQNIVSFTYNDARGWPFIADGAGHSLVPLDFAGQTNGFLDDGGNWRASTYRGGSPGVADPALFL
ncbi:MAG: lamin tail domain-containing protein, partial [Verrucomicrobiota bacterium]